MQSNPQPLIRTHLYHIPQPHLPVIHVFRQTHSTYALHPRLIHDSYREGASHENQIPNVCHKEKVPVDAETQQGAYPDALVVVGEGLGVYIEGIENGERDCEEVLRGG